MTRTQSTMTTAEAFGTNSPFQPRFPAKAGQRLAWAQLHGSSLGLAIARATQEHAGPVLLITADTPGAARIEEEIRFFLGAQSERAVLPFPDWETLPYDTFSPHQDIISQRLTTLYRLPGLRQGIVIVPMATLMHRLGERTFVEGSTFFIEQGQHFDIEGFRARLETSGYRCVSQVMEHGEFAVRGSVIDIFPMGSETPFRLDLFDNDVESLRLFDPETQRSTDKIPRIELLPAREFPVAPEAIKLFRNNYRTAFGGDPSRSLIYRDVSQGALPAGIEYYLPLFFSETTTLLDYFPDDTLVVCEPGIATAAEQFLNEAAQRYEQRRHDIERPLLEPARLFLRADEVFAGINRFQRIDLIASADETPRHVVEFASSSPPSLPINARAANPLENLDRFLDADPARRVLFAAETAGRRETLLDLLADEKIRPTSVDDWDAFLTSEARIAITVAPLERGLVLSEPNITIVTEPQLFGEQAVQRRRRQERARDSDTIIRDLTELNPGAPVVHEEHGVGRYVGLQTLTIGNIATEFLTLEYEGGDKLYVPVSSLHLISRYTGGAPEQAPLHRLGSDQWQKARERAAKKAFDVAAELLDIYARRAARQGRAYPKPGKDYAAFAAAFPFEETPDQSQAIHDVIRDMTAEQPMDRLICGDVGFGKTEVAMRAAFLASHGGTQVAVLVPTTLLAQQHYQNFKDRFADWPVRVEVLSRFRSKKEQEAVLADMENGKVDIVIGTHKLIQENILFKDLGLVIIDEEHRFGVRQKERLKALRAEVDVLTLSATPIPRTLNMAISAIRDLSIIATPPSKRLAIKTFVQTWSDALVYEACLREIKRGGQVYFLHNDIDSIEKIANTLEDLVPEAKVRIGHGQMSERELERVMLDFYHHRFNVLVCTTIIETGIDIPTANTIIINRADRFGLAQLYQLRGRVGRSHHRAYAYLIAPPKGALTKDAEKRLDVIASLEELGAGFTLAIHDMEIRGAGEILGEDQSGQIQEVGFSLYTEMLERAVRALKRGEQPVLDKPLDQSAEIDLHIPALIPEDYLPDVHSRLVLYKRIANAGDDTALRELQVEMIDRFGLLPPAAKNLFRLAQLRLKAKPLGVNKIEAAAKGGRIVFAAKPRINLPALLRLIQTRPKEYKLDGEQKLRFSLELPDAGQRIKAVDELLETLKADEAGG